MIRGHVALIRQLRSFFETSSLPWGAVRFVNDHDEDGRVIYDDLHAQIKFTHRDKTFEIGIWAPSPDRIEGRPNYPLGDLAARRNGELVRGPIDQVTWDRIVEFMNK